MKHAQTSRRRLVDGAWLLFSAATITGSLVVLAIYVNAYDDNGLTERLGVLGGFTRRAMRALSFPLGLPFGAVANDFLEGAFGCADPAEPCGVFIDWWTHFAAVFMQVLLLRWVIRRQARGLTQVER